MVLGTGNPIIDDSYKSLINNIKFNRAIFFNFLTHNVKKFKNSNLYVIVFLIVHYMLVGGDCMNNNTKKNSKGLVSVIMKYINGDDAKLESNIIDVDKSHENYIKRHQ